MPRQFPTVRWQLEAFQAALSDRPDHLPAWHPTNRADQSVRLVTVPMVRVMVLVVLAELAPPGIRALARPILVVLVVVQHHHHYHRQ
jgi:ferric-dicitrate binding protein FerR (iron transport regulator)